MPPKPKRKLSAKAVRLLRQVEKHILAEPTRYDQQTYGKRTDISPCGTAACIAGWIFVLARGKVTKQSLNLLHRSLNVTAVPVILNVMKSLGLELSDPASVTLFGMPYGWPQPYCSHWAYADSFKQRAKVAVARIEHFIQTDGAE